ncbi:MAG: hypothetical protein NTV86_03150 [Planctomycetota bacterium]|nr:hypothetical protein [Planctomycetota bacterium]
MIRYKCKNCSADLESPDTVAGHNDTCSECGELNRVPLVGQKQSLPTVESRSPSPGSGTKSESPNWEPPTPEEQRAIARENLSTTSRYKPEFFGGVFYLLGGITLVGSILAALLVAEKSGAIAAYIACSGIVSGVFLIGFGVNLDYLKQIAVNTYHIRRAIEAQQPSAKNAPSGAKDSSAK